MDQATKDKRAAPGPTRTRPEPEPVSGLELRERRADLTCSYCRGALGARARLCPGCGSLLHSACQVELGRCPTLGCAWAARCGEDGYEVPLNQVAARASGEKSWESLVASLCGLAMACGGGLMARQLLIQPVSLVEGAFWGVFCIGMIMIGGITALSEGYRVGEAFVKGGPLPRRALHGPASEERG